MRRFEEFMAERTSEFDEVFGFLKRKASAFPQPPQPKLIKQPERQITLSNPSDITAIKSDVLAQIDHIIPHASAMLHRDQRGRQQFLETLARLWGSARGFDDSLRANQNIVDLVKKAWNSVKTLPAV